MTTETTNEIPRLFVDLPFRAREAYQRERQAAEERAESDRRNAIARVCRSLESCLRQVLELDVEIDERAFGRPEDVRVLIDNWTFTTRWSGHRNVLLVELQCDECLSAHRYEVPSLAHLHPLFRKVLRCADGFQEQREDD